MLPPAPDPAEPWSIRPLERLDELEACVRLQEEVWGEGFRERAPVSILKVAHRLGGVVAGGFDAEGTLSGFVFGLTGIEDGRPVHWSDMLAVRPGLRDRGLGLRLKTWQRDRCLERGVRRVYWTFDPLESRNAWINLGRLGAVAGEYVRNMYGASDSPLHRGLGTDRLVALWPLDSARVEERLAGGRPPPSRHELGDVPLAFPVGGSGADTPYPEGPQEPPGGDALLVPIPADIQAVKEADPELARAWRDATRAALAPRLAEGWEVRELVRSPGAVSYYLLRPREAR